MPGRAGPAPATTRWLFGDQLGPHFLDDHHGPVFLVESRRVFARKAFHRQKAHLVLSAMRHRAAELGRRVTYARVDRYRDALAQVGDPTQVIQPTSRAAVELVRGLAEEREIERLPARGHVTTREEFEAWAASRGRRRLLMEDFYRDARRRHAVLMDGTEPVGGRWNLDAENREPSPKDQPTLGVPEPRWPQEDDIDAEVRADLDRWERDGDVRFVGTDGPRLFAATRTEALAALDDFVRHRLPHFGPHEDAVLTGDPWMAHSLLSGPQPRAARPARGRRGGRARIPARRRAAPVRRGLRPQVMGWRDYVWHLYWHLGENYRTANRLNARRHLPDW